MRPVVIETTRFTLRSLTVDDATARYSNWLDDPVVAKHIVAAKAAHDVASLRRYIAEKSEASDVLFLGIFVRERSIHIGNLKFEPIDHASQSAILGIMIGEPAWRGHGVAPEVIMGAARWLRDHCGISKIFLGLEATNHAALRAYRSCGFVPVPTHPEPQQGVDVIRMALEIGD